MKKVRFFLLLLGVGVLVWLVRKMGLHTIGDSLARLGWGFLAILVLALGWHVLKTIAWMLALEPGSHRIPFRAFFEARLIGEAFNYMAVLTSMGGEPLKAYALNDRLRMSRGMASVILDRIIYTATSVLFAVLGLTVFLGRWHVEGKLHTALIVALAGLLTFCAAVFALFQFRVHALTRAVRVLSKMPGLGRLLRTKIDSVEKVDGYMLALFHDHPMRFFGSLLLHLSGLVLAIVEIHLILRLTGSPVGLGTAFLLASLTLILNSISFVIPASVGSFEGGHYLMFHLLGLNPEAGLTLAITKRIRALFWVGVGLLLLARARRSPSSDLTTSRI